MSEPELLEYMRGYGTDLPSLEAGDPAKVLAHLCEASYHHPEWFAPGIVGFAVARIDAAPGHVYTMLHNLGRMDLFADLFERHPEAAQDAIYYVATNSAPLLRPRHVDLVCAHFPANPYKAYTTLQYVHAKRPELVARRVMEDAVRHVALAPNQAFYLIREVVRARPEFSDLCATALFECVAHESHARVRAEMLQDIVLVAERSHARTELEAALRRPPRTGGRRARALMAILFRQTLRARQQVLLDALKDLARWESVWDFFLFLVDASDPRQVSTSVAEEFLESAYRLLHLAPFEFETLLADRLRVPDAEAPEEVAALGPELAALYARVARFGPVRLRPLEEFRDRIAAAEREREEIARRLRGATTRRRRKMEAREKALADRLAAWRSLGVTPADLKDLRKKVKDALVAEVSRIPTAAIRAAMNGVYSTALRGILGREYEISRVDPHILPSFVYYEALGRMPNNRRCLARLIEDRLEGRPHDWLRTEPAALAWAQRVRSALPGVRLDRWRAEFSREYAYGGGRRNVEGDLEQTRRLLGVDTGDYETLRALFVEKRAELRDAGEIEMNLERIRIALRSEESDYAGKVLLAVETDPFQVLFMGEYGFASCLSIRGPNVWSAVSNAIDVDKAVVWAKVGGNIVGRRLLALVPEGVVSYRTYSNRYGLALDPLFETFLGEYAAHCGAPVAHGVSPGPLLSDAWYDDGAL